MPAPTLPARLATLDDYVRAFEAAGDDATPEAFAPPAGHPLYPAAVRELVRVDLELGWARGRPRALDDYRGAFPAVFADPAALADIALEEYRQRRANGENPSPDDYARRFGVDTAGWPRTLDELERTAVRGCGDAALAASVAYRQFRATGVEDDDAPTGVVGEALELFREVHRADPEAAERLAEAAERMPEAGDDFLGFRLEVELGRGAFGRVYLARQGDLADRPVALKIAADLRGESDTLARLQHANIVPVYSVHRAGPVQAVCMPYFGPTTLADVVRGLRRSSALPTSGKHLVSTLNDRKSHTREARPADAPPAPPAAAPVPAVADVGPHTLLHKLEGFTYVEAVLWLGARLADGLAHAHERGVVHRDLKPANVLLTDDGQPMLLDFNLSADARLGGGAAAASMGGTLPYMSPEQLEAFRGAKRAVDQRSDLYSLGLILFELLTGRSPYPGPSRPVHSSLSRMLDERRRPPPRLCPLSRAVSPAVESIVRKCLEPDPARRYQSARDLQEDIERHLQDRPLRFAPEPSWRERAGKWVRRHPRLTSSSSVAAAAVVLLLGLGSAALAYARHQQADLEVLQGEQARAAAAETLARLSRARHAQQALVLAPDRTAAQRVAELAQTALAECPLPDQPDWQEHAPAAHLTPEGRQQLRRDGAEVLIAWADAESRAAESEADADRRAAHFTRAWELNARAETCLGGDLASQALWRQRARLAARLGRPDASELAKKASQAPPATADDFVHLARGLLRQREFRKAVPPLVEATRRDPQHFWAWLYLGHCYYEQLQFNEALACISAAAGATPDPSVAYYPAFQRALVHAARGRDPDAAADLQRAVSALRSLPPELRHREQPRPAIERAKLFVRKKDYVAAESVLTDALAAGSSAGQLYFERARVRELRKDADGARKDRAAGLRHEPADEVEWNVRGLARLASDPHGALADFDTALKLDPLYYPALQNKSHVLSERLGLPDEARPVLDRIVELYPGYVRARIGRGVLLARAGQRDAAHADARAALARDRGAATLYQAANVYALTSRQEPADRERVLPLLAAALWGGFGLEVVERDSDMEAIRDLPGFKQLIEGVRESQSDARLIAP